MLKYKVAAGGIAAIGSIFAASKIKLDSHTPAKFLNEEELKSVFITKHGETSSSYFDFSELPSLGEDGNCQGTVGPYQCWGIFDGHGGWSTSVHVSNNILNYLRAAYEAKTTNYSFWGLFKDKSSVNGDELSSREFDEVIASAFTTLDNDILKAPLEALKKNNIELAAASLPVAFSGACGMVAFYHPLRHLLKVALVGDSRTVLGVQNSDGVWYARNLTYDQTGSTPSEIARIRAEHPNDPPEIVSRGRVLGYQPSRSFGDSNTKYTQEQQLALKNSYWAKRISSLCRTPPYLTAMPVTSTVELDPTRPSFMVMGCDGLYEWLTNEQVVDLVGQWLDKNPVIKCKKYAGVVDASDDGSSKEFNFPRYLGWGPLKPTVQDDNAATHLIRNALGGAEFTKVSLLVSIPAPVSRRHRDDISCTVVFFNPTIKPKL